MKMNELIEALQILVTYCNVTDDEYVGVSHDEIITGPSGQSGISDPHLKRLDELGWQFDENETCWRKFA